MIKTSTDKDYSNTPLVEKLGIKKGHVIYLENIPDHYFELVKIPSSIKTVGNPEQNLNFIHVFVTEKHNLNQILPKLKTYLSKKGMIWISWPKRTSSIETDLDENVIREIGLKYGLVDVKVVAFDEDYSGLKFIFRVEESPL